MTQSPLEKLSVYKGYKDLEQRRESDKQVRMAIVAELAKLTVALTDVQNEALSGGGIAHMDALGTLKTQIQTLADKVAAAPRGYSGLFSARDIKADTLDAITNFDRELLVSASEMGGVIDAVGTAMGEGKGERAAIKAATQAVKGLATRFDQRSKLISG